MLLLYFVGNTNDLQGMTSAEPERKRAYSADICWRVIWQDRNGLTFLETCHSFAWMCPEL